MRLGKPEEDNQTEYQEVLVDGVIIYATQDVINYKGDSVLRVDTETTLFGKRLVIYGLPLKADCGGCTSC